MPTQLKEVIKSFLTWSAYEKLAMSMTWQISPGAVLLQLPYTTQSALECSWVLWLLFFQTKQFMTVFFYVCLSLKLLSVEAQLNADATFFFCRGYTVVFIKQ
jgi:hypothetical protein